MSPHPRATSLRTSGVRRRFVFVVLLTLLTVPAFPDYDLSDEPLLASSISQANIELRGRYVRQWRQDDGTLVLMFNGRFRLDMGQRRMTADSAVVWIKPQVTDPGGRKYFELTVYLSGNAEVREIAGTVTLDSVLLVRGLRTYGQIIKYQDAHSSESMEDSLLYQQAVRDRDLIEQGEAPPHAPDREVARPMKMRHPEVVRPPRVVRYRLNSVEPTKTADGESVFVATDGVYFAQAGGPDAAMLEIRAQNAVVFPSEGSTASFLGGEPTSAPSQPEERPDAEPGRPLRPTPPEEGETEPPAKHPEVDDAVGFRLSSAQQSVRAVYLEGDVVLSMGNRFVRANRLYYDFEHDRALILDAVLRVDVPEREIPLYIRAEEIRQLSAREFSADDACVTTSEFYTPSYHVGAERVVLDDLTVRDREGRAAGPVAGHYALTNTTLNVGGVPILWWPYSAGNLQASETLLRRVRTGYSSDRGFELETSWYLFGLLGIDAPEGYDASLDLTYFSERGPGIGLRADYAREDYYGLFRGYFIHDDGEDTLGLLRRADESPSTPERGRVLWRHRQYLPHDWEATVEVAYVSDPYFLEEYEKAEWFEGKQQETLVRLKRARDTEAITLLANWRMLDFLTQTEHLPELTYRRIGDTFLSPIVLYHESRIGAVRYMTREWDASDLPYRLYRQQQIGVPLVDVPSGSDVTFRTDVRQEAELPLKLGPLSVVPFASLRGSYWDGQPTDEGGLWRGLGVYGVRGGISFSRTFDDVESELFDIHKIRHVIQPDFAAWWANSNARSKQLTPFDYGIESADDFYGVMVGLRQTWQTKRGAPDNRRTVDLLTFNVEAGFFGNVHGRPERSDGYADLLRPENSRPQNYLAGELIYRMSDTTSLLYDFNVDVDNWVFDRHNVSVAVERNPRLAYLFGARFAGDINMNLIGGGWNYRLTEKHLTTVRAWYDLDRGDLGEISFGYVRKMPRWYIGLNFEYDNLDDDFTITVSLWPEGIPEWALGSRRFTGLAQTTGIRP